MIATTRAKPHPRPRFRMAPWVLGLVLAFVALADTGHAGRVRSLGIEALTGRAGTIFSGRCTAVRMVEHKDLGQPVAELTFAVLRGVKGIDGRQQITVRMLPAGSLAGFPEGPGGGIRSGDEVVLFLYPESRLGLTSPVGLGQGRFAVLPDLKGGRIAVNPWGNRTLLAGTAEPVLLRLAPEEREQLQTGRLRPDTLLDVADRLTREARSTAAEPAP